MLAATGISELVLNSLYSFLASKNRRYARVDTRVQAGSYALIKIAMFTFKTTAAAAEAKYESDAYETQNNFTAANTRR